MRSLVPNPTRRINEFLHGSQVALASSRRSSCQPVRSLNRSASLRVSPTTTFEHWPGRAPSSSTPGAEAVWNSAYQRSVAGEARAGPRPQRAPPRAAPAPTCFARGAGRRLSLHGSSARSAASHCRGPNDPPRRPPVIDNAHRDVRPGEAPQLCPVEVVLIGAPTIRAEPNAATARDSQPTWWTKATRHRGWSAAGSAVGHHPKPCPLCTDGPRGRGGLPTGGRRSPSAGTPSKTLRAATPASRHLRQVYRTVRVTTWPTPGTQGPCTNRPF